MKEKIKNFFEFVKSAWVTSARGKFGFILMLLSIFFFVRLFMGTQNVQSFVLNMWKLNHEKQELTVAQNNLKQLQQHIYLLQHPNNSADYIEELGLKTLNLGDPNFKELKY
ncbi:MAG: hypothetical protein IKN73_01745 [Alphaproteobacteria bacterium]|nr:hypothetical protein [Alphaproteobacteria bacterium]